MLNKKLKLIFACMMAATITLSPFFAFAQVFGVTTPLTPMYTAGVPAPNDIPVAAALKAQEALNTGYTTAEQAYLTSNNVKHGVGLGGLDLISGGTTLKFQLIDELTALNGFIHTRQVSLETVTALTTTSSYVAQERQVLISQINSAIAALRAKAQSISAQLDIVNQGFWKSLLVKILIQTTQSVGANLVNHLVSNYKINNLVNYAGSLAALVYDNQYIQANYSGSNADQMIIRSFLQNPAVDSLSPSILSKANLALGFAPNSLQASDPNFYVKLGMLGGVQANPYYQQVAMQSQAASIHNAALAAAQTQISQSNGFKAPMSCPGVVAQQQSIDQAYKAANDQVTNRAGLTNQLLLAQQMGKAVSATDLAKAQADLKAAQSQLDNLPKSFDSGAITICKDIVSPASLIDKGINEALHSVGQSLSTYNDNNLPFFTDFISGVASRIANDLIFGGSKSGNLVINELKNDAVPAAGLAAGVISSDLQSKQTSGLTITTQAILDDPSNAKNTAVYSISWDASGVSNATGVIISGSGLPTGMNGVIQPGISGTARLVLPPSGSYTYTVTAVGKSKADVLAVNAITILPKAVQQTLAASTTTSASPQNTAVQQCIAQGGDPGYCQATVASSSTSNSTSSSSALSVSCSAGGYATYQACLDGNSQSHATCNSLCGVVAGASASRPTEPIRGSFGISPR